MNTDTAAPTDDQLHLAVSTFLAVYTGGNGLDAMRQALEAIRPPAEDTE